MANILTAIVDPEFYPAVFQSHLPLSMNRPMWQRRVCGMLTCHRVSVRVQHQLVNANTPKLESNRER